MPRSEGLSATPEVVSKYFGSERLSKSPEVSIICVVSFNQEPKAPLPLSPYVTIFTDIINFNSGKKRTASMLTRYGLRFANDVSLPKSKLDQMKFCLEINL